METETESGKLRAWVGCLACYNSGELRGEWVDALEAEDWACPIAQHQETWIMDTDGFGSVDEMSPAAVVELAEWIESAQSGTLDGVPVPVLLHMRAEYGDDLQPIEDNYRGCWDSLREMIENDAEGGLYGEALRELADTHAGWIDWEQMAYDAECGGDYVVIEHDGDTFVWWSW